MVKLDIVKIGNATLVASQPLVAVFVGGTSGIGALTVKCLAETHGTTGKGLRLYIIGRNAKAADGVITECKKLCPSGQFIFLPCTNLALMKEVDKTSTELIKLEEKEALAKGQEPKIDILCMSQAIFKPWEGRNETSEGLDTFMSLLWYSRGRFIHQLLPLLLACPTYAHIISVFGPSRDQSFFPTDLSLRSPKNYGFMSSGSHAAYFKTFYFEYLAAKYPGKLSLVHYYPGLILHDGMHDPTHPAWLRAMFKYGAPILRLAPMTLPVKESGMRTLYNASERFPTRAADGKGRSAGGGQDEIAESSDGVIGGGAYRTTYHDGPMPVGKQYVKMRQDGWAEKAVQHSQKVWDEIEATGVFTG